MNQTPGPNDWQERDRLTRPWKTWLAGASLVALVTVVYWPTVHSGFLFDDDYYVEQNVEIRSLEGLANIWLKPSTFEQYYPLVYSTYWVEYRLWGLDPRGYHFVNLLLHAASAVVVWRLLLRLGVPGAWLAAAIFGVHPIQIENMALLHERKNVLSCLLALGSLLAYLRFSPPEGDRLEAEGPRPEADHPPTTGDAAPQSFGGRTGLHSPAAAPGTSDAPEPTARRRWRFYALALVLYIAAILAKTATASVPAVVLVIYWWKRGRLTWRDVVRTAPFFAVGLALCAITVMKEKALGATGNEWNFSLVERILIAGRALWFYAGKLAWPHPLTYLYHRWVIDAHVWWQYLFPAAALAVFVGLWSARTRIGRGPLAAVLIFVGVLVPGLGFFDLFMFRVTFVVDYIQYHAGIALIALVVAAAATLLGRFPKRARWWGPVAGAALLLPLAVLAHDRTDDWKDEFSVWQDNAAQDPESWAAHSMLGFYYLQQGMLDEVLSHCLAATESREQLARDNPRLSEYKEDLAASYAGLGDLQKGMGRLAEAEVSIDKALLIREKLARENPTVGDFQNAVALSYIQFALSQHMTGHPADAIASCQQAIRILEKLTRESPTIGRYRDNLGWSYATLGRARSANAEPVEAEAAHRKAIEIREKLAQDKPTSDQDQGRFDKSLGARRAQDILIVSKYFDNVAASYVDLGELQRQMGRLAEAQNAFSKAIAIREQLVRDHPAVSAYWDGLAWCYVDLALVQQNSAQPALAVASHRKALEIRQKLAQDKPAFGNYKNNVAASYADIGILQRARGRFAEAQAAFCQAIEIREKLVAENPGATDYRSGLAWCYVHLLVAQYESGRASEAEASCRKAIEIREKLAQEHPSVAGYKHELAASYRDLGNLLRATGRTAEAEIAYRRASEIREQVPSGSAKTP